MSRLKGGSSTRPVLHESLAQIHLRQMTGATPVNTTEISIAILAGKIYEQWGPHLDRLTLGGFAKTDPRYSNGGFEVSTERDKDGNVAGYFCRVSWAVASEIVMRARLETVNALAARAVGDGTATLSQKIYHIAKESLEGFYSGMLRVTRDKPYYDGADYWLNGFVLVPPP